MSHYGYNKEVLRQLLEEKSKRLVSCGEERFVSGLGEITGILSRMQPAPSPTMQAVDAKGQDYGTYYFAPYSGTMDVDRSFETYVHAKNLVRIIVLMDRFYEVGNKRYRRLGEALITKLKKKNDENLTNSLVLSLKQFWPFWSFEQFTKKLMMEGHRFSLTEVRRFNLLKSSDAALIYAPLLEGVMPELTHNESTVIHFNQALQDIEDDFDDVLEDLKEQMPNAFILAAMGREAGNYRYSELRKQILNGSRTLILDNSANTILQLVNEYATCIDGIQLKPQFGFLKYLSRHYVGRIRAKLAEKFVEA